ncbi:ETC complex I subunit conserved region-domain-containing protein [Coniella lustricola]|uniref:ETC complex I subunit conserved region-domain-containing protein n=1 Tax=Coniella lustricola TaxID=2025994 RepID=A0A2T3A315_9PEZI|nr:ETC complex I subunit conserved region-domain-containing protein [Coniella lustricola]
MRPALRLFASVKPVAPRYLEVGAPTGLTGLFTNPSPRSTLLYLYSSTLDKLRNSAIPETSVYRQSVEAVTKHRLALVQAVQPAGYDEWRTRALAALERHPEHFAAADGTARLLKDGSLAASVNRDGTLFVLNEGKGDVDVRYNEWDGEPERETPTSSMSEEESKRVWDPKREDPSAVRDAEWENEPQLTAVQIEELENKIGAGLIEEVIQVAENEYKLIDTMVEAKVWESLEEKPREGQWTYFERKD